MTEQKEKINIPIDYNFEKLLKDFLNKVKKSRILQEIKERRYYTKPSTKKREELRERRNK